MEEAPPHFKGTKYWCFKSYNILSALLIPYGLGFIPPMGQVDKLRVMLFYPVQVPEKSVPSTFVTHHHPNLSRVEQDCICLPKSTCMPNTSNRNRNWSYLSNVVPPSAFRFLK